MTRVAAVQFATADSVEDNLATCQRRVDEAAATGAAVNVLPEFCNHLSWYRDHARHRGGGRFSKCGTSGPLPIGSELDAR